MSDKFFPFSQFPKSFDITRQYLKNQTSLINISRASLAIFRVYTLLSFNFRIAFFESPDHLSLSLSLALARSIYLSRPPRGSEPSHGRDSVVPSA